jgi:hypothetical protein
MPRDRYRSGASFFQPLHPGIDFVDGILVPVILLKLAVEHAMPLIQAKGKCDRQGIDADVPQAVLKRRHEFHAVVGERVVHKQNHAVALQRFAMGNFKIAGKLKSEIVERNLLSCTLLRVEPHKKQRQKRNEKAAHDFPSDQQFDGSALLLPVMDEIAANAEKNLISHRNALLDACPPR